MYQYCLLPLLLNWNKLWHDCSLGSKLSFTLNPVDIGIQYQQNIQQLYCSLYISHGTDKEKLFNNQSICNLVIISFILMILLFDSGGILLGEIRC